MIRELTIGQRLIDDSTDCYVIAEIGHNHQGDIDKARDLIRTAADCGVDAVKFQKRDNQRLFTRALYEKPYEHENSFGATYGEHRDFLEFGRSEFVELKALAEELGVGLFATPFERWSADFLAEIDVPAFKIASGDLKNTPLLRHVAAFGKPMIVSTGGGTMEDVRRAAETVLPINHQLALLQCTASYPTEPDDLNLRCIETFREEFPHQVVGLSDHFNGIAMSVVAFVLGARIVEKHFTLNHTWRGTDHAFSLEPIGMRKMVRDLRRARAALGSGRKTTLEIEEPALEKMGKSLYAAHPLDPGSVLKVEDIAIKSPGGGLPPFELDRVVGSTIRTALEEEQAIELDHLES
jgi:N-acetylneuraminate synthase/sialic acid synthase